MKPTQLPPLLSEVAAGRDYILTAEYARAIGRTGQTIRKRLCEDGEAYGVRPVKVGGRLLWPVAEIARVLAGRYVGAAR